MMKIQVSNKTRIKLGQIPMWGVTAMKVEVSKMLRL